MQRPGPNQCRSGKTHATDAVAKRVTAGKVSPVEETKASGGRGRRAVELAAQSEQRSARARLASLLGANPPRFTQVAGSVDDLPNVPSLDDIQQRLSASSALRRAQLEIERRRSLADVERSKQTPDVTVSLGVKRPNELARNQLMLGISVPLPLFDRNQGNLLEALKREDKAQGRTPGVESAPQHRSVASPRAAGVGSRRDRRIAAEVLPGARAPMTRPPWVLVTASSTFWKCWTRNAPALPPSPNTSRRSPMRTAAADMDRVIGASEPTTTPPANKE